MNEKESYSKCENCASIKNFFKVTILSPCREHSHAEIYCKKHLSNIIREFPEEVDLIEKI